MRSMSHIEFGQSLDRLLSTLGISINRLAKAINVDSSLANRWVNGKRIPAYDSMYIEDIAEFLAQNVKNSLQIQHIEKLFEEVHGTKEDTPSDIKDRIRKILYESQGYSLELYKRKKTEIRCHHDKKDTTSNSPPTSTTPSTLHLSTEDTIIFGTHNIIAACNDVLHLAVNSPSTLKGRIYITAFNEVPIEKKEQDDVLRFQSSLLIMMEKGWEIHVLAKISDNTHQSMGLISFLKPLIRNDKLFVHYINDYGYTSSGKDFVIVSNYCAADCLFLNSKSACTLFRTPAAVDLYTEYVKSLITNFGHPLLTHYANEEGAEYNLSLANCEDSIGNRILYKDCFGVVTFPMSLYKKLLIRRNLSQTDIRKALVLYKKRYEAFKLNIDTYEYYDLYQINCINDLIKNQRIFLYDHTGIHSVPLKAEEIILLFENIIHLLQRHPNYHIAFVTEKRDESPLQSTLFYCVVKEKKKVFLVASNPQGSEPVRLLSIEEPMMVFALEVYFKKLWLQLAPVLKDKNAIIQWLQREINLLRARS